jgi:hypothetical protein
MKLLRIVAAVFFIGSLAAPAQAQRPMVLRPTKPLVQPKAPTVNRQLQMHALPSGATVVRHIGDIPSGAPYQLDTTKSSVPFDFYWNVRTIPAATGIIWQVAMSPFSSSSDIAPPGLLASGSGTGATGRFSGDFKSIVANAHIGRQIIESFYVRVLPVAGSGPAQHVVGQPSNVIRAYYVGQQPQGPPLVLPYLGPNDLYKVTLVSFSPPDFADPNKWGCVVVVRNDNPIDTHKVGATYCPDYFRGDKSDQITSVGGFVDWAAEGIVSAFDWVAGAYNGLKNAAVNAVLTYTHACDLMGAAGAGDECKTVANAAVDAGMMALGVPPSIPNFDQMVDEGVDGAVQLAADQVSEQTGVPCVGPCQDALRKGFSTAADAMKNAAFAPGCVGDEEAHRHGREKLCFEAGVIVRPAPRSIDLPPRAVAEVTHVQHRTDGQDKPCFARARIDFANHFPGGTVTGPTAGDTIDVRAQPVKGELYEPATLSLSPSMPIGKPIRLPLLFSPAKKYEFPWTHDLWATSEIPPRDEQGAWGPDWLQLYWGSTARVTLSTVSSSAGQTNCQVNNNTVLVQQMPLQ